MERYDPVYAREVFERAQKRGGAKFFFNDFIVYGSENLHKEDQNRPRLYIANHLSHADYIQIWLQIQAQGAKMPMMASGKNLDLKSLKMMGIDFGRLCAFWVDREKLENADRNEARKVGGIVGQFVREGNDILYFPEGGRSYSGKLFQTYKTGVMKRFLQATQELETTPEIVPIAFAYNNRVEDGFFNALKFAKDLGKIGKPLYVGLDALAFAKAHLIKDNRTSLISVGKPTPLEEIVSQDASLPEKIEAVKNFSIQEITNLYKEIKQRNPQLFKKKIEEISNPYRFMIRIR